MARRAMQLDEGRRRECERTIRLILLFEAGIRKTEAKVTPLKKLLRATLEACGVERLEAPAGIAQLVREETRPPTPATWTALRLVPAALLGEIASLKAKAAEERKDTPEIAAVLATLGRKEKIRLEVDPRLEAGATVVVTSPSGTARA